MPKKFLGENTKAAAAKDKKSQAKGDLRLIKEQDELDQQWADTCKAIDKKLKRRESKEVKRQEQSIRKMELKELLKKESQDLSNPKVKAAKAAKAASNNAQKKNETHLTQSLTENLNRLTIGEEIARTIDQALSLLNDRTFEDKHPEKRLKAAHKAFEDKRLKELKVTHPTLKLSQLKEIAFKEWRNMQPKI